MPVAFLGVSNLRQDLNIQRKVMTVSIVLQGLG